MARGWLRFLVGWPASLFSPETDMAVGQNQWYHFGVGAPPISVYFCGDWDVHWGYDSDFGPWPYLDRKAVLRAHGMAPVLSHGKESWENGRCPFCPLHLRVAWGCLC